MTDVQVRTDFRSNPEDLLKAYEKIAAEQNAMRARLETLGRTSRRHAEESKTGLEAMLPRLTAVASGYLSIRSAIDLVNRSLERKAELERAAAQTTLSVAQAEVPFLYNVGDVAEDEKQRLRGRVRAIQRETGVDEVTLLLAASDALSAKGEASADTALDNVLLAARAAGANRETAQGLAAALLDVSKITGSTDATANFGFVTALQANARVVDLPTTGRNLVPAAANLVGYGYSPQEAAALVAALTGRTVDVTGAQSGTAAVQLGEQLATSFAGQRGGDAIRFLQQNPQLAEQFLADASFETKARQPIRELLLDPNSQIAREFRRISAVFPTEADSRAVSERLIGGVQTSESQIVSQALRDVDAYIERQQLENPLAALAGGLRERLPNVLGSSGAGYVDEQLILFEQRVREGAGADELETLLDPLRERAEFVSTRQIIPGKGIPFLGLNAYSEPTEAGIREGDALRFLVERLEAGIAELRKEMSRAADAAEEQARVKPTPVTDGGER